MRLRLASAPYPVPHDPSMNRTTITRMNAKVEEDIPPELTAHQLDTHHHVGTKRKTV